MRIDAIIDMCNYQWQYKQYSVKKLNFYCVNLQIGESLVTAVEI